MRSDSDCRVLNEYARTLIRVKARRMIGRWGFSSSDQGDIEQDLILHLLNQAQQFDPARASLNTFIARVVESAAAMLVRGRRRQKRVPVEGLVVQSLEVTIDQPDGPPTPLGATITSADLDRRTGKITRSEAETHERSEAIEHAIHSLPSELQELCRHLMHLNRTNSALEVGLSRRRFEAATSAIRKQFERAGLNELNR